MDSLLDCRGAESYIDIQDAKDYCIAYILVATTMVVWVTMVVSYSGSLFALGLNDCGYTHISIISCEMEADNGSIMFSLIKFLG